MKPVPQVTAMPLDLTHHPDSERNDPRNVEQRVQSDRRGEPTSLWGAFPPAGKRMKARRASEHGRPYYVDRFSALMLLCVLSLVLASLVDAVLTVELLRAGGSEVNPLMDRLLGHSVEAFIVVKYLLTVGGIPLLLIVKNHYLFGTRVRVGYLIAVVVGLYCVLIAYQVVLLHTYVGL